MEWIIQGEKKGIREPAVAPLTLDPLCSRRRVLKMGGISIIGISALGPVLAQGATKPLIVMDKAEGIVVADPLRCVGCGRCELACTEFNDGKAAPKNFADQNRPEFGLRAGRALDLAGRTRQLGGRGGRAGPLQTVPSPGAVRQHLSGKCDHRSAFE